MLGRGVSILIDLFNPEKIVLGGVFMRSRELLEPAMYETIEKKRCPTVIVYVRSYLRS